MTVTAILALLLPTAAMPVHLEPAATRAWFLSTYPAAAAHGEAVYDRLEMNLLCEIRQESGKPEILSGRFTAYDGQFRLDILRDDSAQFADLYIIRPGDSVLIDRHPNGPTGAYCAVESRDFGSLISGIRNSVSLPFAPWYVGDLSIREMLTAEDVSILSVRVTDDPDLGCICTVDWSYCVEHPHPPFGSFCFAVDRGWVLVSHSRMYDRENGIVVRLRYDNREIAGVPIVYTAERWTILAGQPILKRRFERGWFTPVETPGDRFDTTTYRVAAALCPPVPLKNHVWRSTLPAMLGLLFLSLCIQGWRTHKPHLHPPAPQTADRRK